MISCKHCGSASDLYLCPTDRGQLKDMLDEMPWLITQLETTRCGQDKLSTGVVGRGGNPSPIRIGAMELARQVEVTLTLWCDVLCDTAGCKFLPALSLPYGVEGPLLPGWKRLPRGYSGSPVQRARWLSHHVTDIAKHPKAGDCYHDISDLCGDPDKPDTRPGRILLAVNKSERLFAGTCPTITNRDREGKPVECRASLWGRTDQQTTVCDRCHFEIDIVRNRVRCATDGDVMTELKMLPLLDTLGEPVPRGRFHEWIKAGKIAVHGYFHMGQFAPHRVRRGDPRAFSISQVRSLRAQELQAKVAV